MNLADIDIYTVSRKQAPLSLCDWLCLPPQRQRCKQASLLLYNWLAATAAEATAANDSVVQQNLDAAVTAGCISMHTRKKEIGLLVIQQLNQLHFRFRFLTHIRFRFLNIATYVNFLLLYLAPPFDSYPLPLSNYSNLRQFPVTIFSSCEHI